MSIYYSKDCFEHCTSQLFITITLLGEYSTPTPRFTDEKTKARKFKSKFIGLVHGRDSHVCHHDSMKCQLIKKEITLEIGLTFIFEYSFA